MKKLKYMLVLVSLSMVWLLLTGCGNSEKVYSTDGTSICLNGTPLAHISEFDGTTGSYAAEGDPYTITYQVCNAPEMKDCTENRQAVHEDDLTDFNGSKYSDAYMGTMSVMYVPLEGKDVVGNKEALVSTKSKDSATLDAIRGDVCTTLKALDFKPLETVNFTDKVVVKSNGGKLVLRKDGVVIPGTLAVSKGSKEGANQQVQVGDITVMLYESKGFKFYQYGDIVVKIVNTANIEDYIQFK